MGADHAAPMIVQTRAQRLAADAAILAVAAADIVADDDALTLVDAFDLRTQRSDNTRRPISHDAGERHLQSPAASKLHLKKVDADRGHLQQYFARRRLGCRDGLPLEIFGRSEFS